MLDARPTIAVTRASTCPRSTRLPLSGLCPTAADDADRRDQRDQGGDRPGVAPARPRRYGSARRLRTCCAASFFEETGGMFPELVTRPDLELFLPPIGGRRSISSATCRSSPTPDTMITCRVHDECKWADVFGSDICTCRPYLVHGVEVCVETAAARVYLRRLQPQGRLVPFGEVIKSWSVMLRKRQKGGDTADLYFHRTECKNGVQDMRVSRAYAWMFSTGLKDPSASTAGVSMSNMKQWTRSWRRGSRSASRCRDPRGAGPARRRGRDGGEKGGGGISRFAGGADRAAAAPDPRAEPRGVSAGLPRC